MRVLAFMLAIAAFATGLPHKAAAEKRVALVIGNSAYAATGTLTNPVNDAKAIAALFRRAGFEVAEAQLDLGRAAFKRALSDFEAISKGADIAAFYFSGHSAEIGGQEYLLPVDAELARDFDAQDEVVSLDRVIRATEGARRLRLIIVDACRENPFIERMQSLAITKSIAEGVATKSIGKGLDPPVKDVDILIAFAARGGTHAVDDIVGGNSPYVAAMLRHLATPGLDIQLALRRVRDDVMKATHGRQEPFVYGSMGLEEIALVSRSQVARPLQPGALQERPTPAAPLVLPVASPCTVGRRIALVVGNSAYPKAYLGNPINDADDVTALLRDKLCFKVIEAKDANFATFSQRISEFVEASEGVDVALFYFAGHAMQFQQTNYLLPVDAKLANELDLAQRTISAQNVVLALETRAKVSLIFLDSCRNNPIEDDFRRRMKTAQRGFGETRGLASMATLGAETLVVFATRPNQQAADGSGRNSPFTRAFLEHFATPGKDVELVMRDVTSRVLELTNGQQIPQRLTELRHGLVLLPAK